MDPLSIAALVAAGIKGVSGFVQGIGGARKQANLWQSRPQLGVTSGETANDSLYRQMASATELPGQNRAEQRMDEMYASGVYDAQKTSVSSLGATQSAVDLASKKMESIRDLAGMFSEYKDKQQQALAGWNNQKTNLETQRFDVNQMQPWGMKMNEAVSQKQAGFQSFGSGVDSGIGVLGDLAGTESMMEMYKSMYNFGGNGNKGGFGNQSKPLGSPYNPQQNLLNTLGRLSHK